MADRYSSTTPTRDASPVFGETHLSDGVTGSDTIRQSQSCSSQHQNAQVGEHTLSEPMFPSMLARPFSGGFPQAPTSPISHMPTGHGNQTGDHIRPAQVQANQADGDESHTDGHASQANEGQGEADTQPHRRNIDDCIKEIQISNAPLVPALPWLDIPAGDTWAYIKPPAREPEQSDETWKAIQCHYDRPFRVSSQKLKDSESALILKQLSSPTIQYRLIRRLGVTKQKMDSHGVKYVLDLTPPVEGDEAVELTEELSCPSSIVEWARTSQQWRIGIPVAGGKDELTTVDPTVLMEDRDLVRDYTPLRHRFAIQRVLALLHGRDPFLDSAPKLYTTVLVATKHLQIPAYRLTELTGYVTRFACAAPNSMVVELHPEAMLKLADELQIEPLCQDAYAILVGEAALEVSMLENGSLYASGKKTIHGRRRGVLHEVWQTRIEHARYALKQRAKALFEDHIVGSMKWVEELPAVLLIKKRNYCQGPKKIESWVAMLKQYLKGAIYHVVTVCYQEIELPHQKWRVGTFDRNVFRDVFNKLDYKDRVMTRTFWKILSSLDLTPSNWDVASNLDCRISNFSFTIDNTKTSLAKQNELVSATQIVRISTEELENATRQAQLKPAQWYDDAPQDNTDETDMGLLSPRKKPRLSLDASNSAFDQRPLPGGLPLRVRFDDEEDQPVPPATSKKPYDKHVVAQRAQPVGESTSVITGLSSRLITPNPVSYSTFTNSKNGTGSFGSFDATPGNLTVRNPDPSDQEQVSTGDENSANTIPRDRDQILASHGRPFTTNAAGDVWRPWDTSTWTNTDLSLPSAPETDPQGPPPRGRVKQELFRPDSPTTGSAQHPSISPVNRSAVESSPGNDDASTTTINSLQLDPLPRQGMYNHIIVYRTVLTEAKEALSRLVTPMLAQPAVSNNLELDTIDTLVCLTEEETKVLPLWAGGFDDGSGGVFNTEPPMMPTDDYGFGPGRVGLRGVNGDFDGASSFGATDSTANTSKLVNDGDNASVIVDRRRVYAASDVESVDHRGSEAGRSETESDWSRVSATHTPQDSVNGEVAGVLPPESIEAPDFSDSGSVFLGTEIGPEDAVSVVGTERNEPSTTSVAATQKSEEVYMDMFADSDEEDFDEQNLILDDDDDDENMDQEDADEMDAESDYDLVEAESETSGAGTADSDKMGQIVTSSTSTARGREREAGEVLIRYKEREPTPLGFGSEAEC